VGRVSGGEDQRGCRQAGPFGEASRGGIQPGSESSRDRDVDDREPRQARRLRQARRSASCGRACRRSGAEAPCGEKWNGPSVRVLYHLDPRRRPVVLPSLRMRSMKRFSWLRAGCLVLAAARPRA
jgi:hypothetical protein